MNSINTVCAIIFFICILALIAICNNPLMQILLYIGIIISLYVYDKNNINKLVYLSLFIGLPILIINPIINSNGATILFFKAVPVLGTVVITFESIFYSFNMFLKLINTVLAFFLFNILIHPDRLLNMMAVFSYKSSLVLSLSTRMIPLLTAQIREISEVQRTRGVNLDSKNIIEKVKGWYPFLKILLFSSLENSLSMAEAIESKGYGANKRTVFYEEKIRPIDLIVLISSAILIILTITGFNQGWLNYKFFPHLSYLVVSTEQMIYYSLIMIIVFYPILKNRK